MPGPLVIFGNPASETAAWNYVIELAEQAKNTTNAEHRASHLRKLVAVAEEMKRQIKRGVHTNPAQGKRIKKSVVMSHHVQAVAYIHAKDGGAYVHGFGNVDPNENDLRNGILNLSELSTKTNIDMIGHPDGTVELIGTKGQPLAGLFP